jgi:secreted trypsin-like serine protease
LTSWGYGCGDGGVYTRVSLYYQWIQDIRNVWIDIWLKTPKYHVKISIIIGSLEKMKKSIFSKEKAHISELFVLNKLVNKKHLKCMFEIKSSPY